jgi:hypothetical protein
MYGCETWSMIEDRGEEHSEESVCTKNIMGLTDTILIKNHGNCIKHLIWLRIFEGKS